MYRRSAQCFPPAWPLSGADLGGGVVALAPCGGPLAIVPDGGWGISYALATYSMGGELLQLWESLRERVEAPVRAVAVGWCKGDMVTVVYDDGGIVRVSPRVLGGGIVSVGRTGVERVHDAVIMPEGDVVVRGVAGGVWRLSAENAVVSDSVVVPPLLKRVPKAGSNNGIVAMGPDLSPCGDVETLIVGLGGVVSLVNPAGCAIVGGLEQPVSQLALSPNGKYVAAVETGTGHLFVRSVDMRAEIVRVNVNTELAGQGIKSITDVDGHPVKREPEEIAWVGSDAIAAFYGEHLVLIGPHGGVATLELSNVGPANGIVMQSELDGLRLVSSTRVEFVQLVPEVVHAVFCRPQAPSFKLLRACGALVGESCISETESPMEPLARYDLLRELLESKKLMSAARSCAEAAYLVPSPLEQKALLHAVSYGQRYSTVLGTKASDGHDSSLVVPSSRACKGRRDVDLVPTAVAILRVINAVSAREAGVPLTKPQLDVLGLQGLVSRLSRYGKHTLALRLAAYGGVSPNAVFADWASATIHSRGEDTDESLTTLIIERFETLGKSSSFTSRGEVGRGHALPYVNAAEAAFAAGRQRCAELLLRRESRPAPKVAMYLTMGREAQAIMASVASGDPELVLDALGTILQRKSVRETARLLRSLPPTLCNRATDLFASHLKQIGNLPSLRLVYTEVGRHREAALVEIHLADHVEEERPHMAALEKKAHSIGRGPHRRSCHFEVQALQHAAAVASSGIEVEKRARMASGSLRHANDAELLARATRDIADARQRRDMLARLRRELKIPDRRFFWVCLDAMAEAGDFDSIEALSNSAGYGRPPPIGLTAFVDACIKHHKDDEAVKYAMRIADLRDRARALARCGHGREAADIASRLRNQQLLEEVADLAARHVAQIPLPSEVLEDR